MKMNGMNKMNVMNDNNEWNNVMVNQYTYINIIIQ